MAWLRDLEPDALALWAGRDEFARAIREAGFAGEIAGYYGAFEERYIGSDNPTIVEIATASPEFRQFVAERQVQVYAQDMGWMTADIYLLIDGQVRAKISDRPGEFDRVMGVVTDLAVPMILTAGLTAAVAPVVAATGASGAVATGLTRAGASLLFAVGTDAPIDLERIATSALVSSGGAAAMEWIATAGGAPDVLVTDADLIELGAGDVDTGGLLDPWAPADIASITDAGIDLSAVTAAAGGTGVQLGDMVDVVQITDAGIDLSAVTAAAGGTGVQLGDMVDVVQITDAGIDLSAVTDSAAGGGVVLADGADILDLGPGGPGADLGPGSVQPGADLGTGDEISAGTSPELDIDMGDDLSGEILWEPGADDVVTDPLEGVDDFNIELLPPSVFGDPADLEIVGPPILEPQPPGLVPIPPVVIDTGGVVTIDRVVKTVTNAAIAAIGVVKAWEQRKLPVNTTARQTDASGRSTTVTEGGLVQTRTPDGRTTVSRPAVGEPRVTLGGNVVVNNGDGTYTKITPDGKRTIIPYADAAGGVSVGGLNVPPELLYVGLGALVLFAMRGKR